MSTLCPVLLSSVQRLTMQLWSDVMAGPDADQVKMKKDTVAACQRRKSSALLNQYWYLAFVTGPDAR
jgi:hypothetical protein